MKKHKTSKLNKIKKTKILIIKHYISLNTQRKIEFWKNDELTLVWFTSPSCSCIQLDPITKANIYGDVKEIKYEIWEQTK